MCSFPRTFIRGRENTEKKPKQKKKNCCRSVHTFWTFLCDSINTYVKSRNSHGRHAATVLHFLRRSVKWKEKYFCLRGRWKKNEKKKNSTAFPLMDFFFVLLSHRLSRWYHIVYTYADVPLNVTLVGRPTEIVCAAAMQWGHMWNRLTAAAAHRLGPRALAASRGMWASRENRYGWQVMLPTAERVRRDTRHSYRAVPKIEIFRYYTPYCEGMAARGLFIINNNYTFSTYPFWYSLFETLLFLVF